MDKLQPLIKHRYWICFGLSVVFVVVGWWMASGAIALEIEDRMKKVEESFTKATQGATKPNKSWVEAAKKENEADTQSYDRASKQLLQRQKNARKWPDALVNSMKGISYRQDLKDTTTRARWASIYRDQIEQLLQIVKPFKDGEGLVLVDTNKISHKPFNSWRTSRPSSTEIWNCQEDIWLLESLLKSIARVNEGATRLTESQIRQIFKLQLRGGDRNAAPAGGAAAGGMGGMSMSGAEGMGAAYMAGGMGVGGEMGVGGGGASYPGKEFEGSAGTDILTEEFGAFSAGGAGGMGMGGMATMGSMGSMAMSGGAEGMAGGAAGGAPAEEKRYVDGGDGDTTLGYKTRAFLLDVMIRDDQVPNLLASLTNSDFPVEIVRVEIVSKLTPSKGAGGMTGGPGMGEMGIGSEMAGGMTGMSEMTGAAEGGGYVAEDPYAGTGGFGGEGGLLGSGGADYDPSALAGGSAAMGMAPGMSGLGVAGGGAQGAKGKEVIQAAMNDPLLVLVKIGGLMTLYQSAQEANAEATTAETDQASTPAAAPDAGGATAAPGAEGTTPVDGATPAEGTTPAEGAAPAEGTTPAEGAAPAEGTAPAPTGDPGAPTDPASESEKPVTNDAPATPADGTPAPASPSAEPGTAAPGASPAPPAPAETPGAGNAGGDPTPPPAGDAPVNP